MTNSALESLWKRRSVIWRVFSESCAVNPEKLMSPSHPELNVTCSLGSQGHYRFCDALFYLGEHQKALRANRLAQDACGADTEGQKDLLQQCERFQTELQESKGNVWPFSTASAASDRFICVVFRPAEMKTRKTETKKTSSKTRFVFVAALGLSRERAND